MTGKSWTIISLAALTLLFSLPGMDAAAQGGRQSGGADGSGAEFRGTTRIVTIGAAVTEIVFALGHGDHVVAVDQTSSFPPVVKSRPNVGYMRALSAEGVLSVAPSVIFATEDAGPPDVIDILSRTAIPFVVVPEGYDEDAIFRKVELIAKALGEEERGTAMAQAIAEDFRSVKAMRNRIEKRRKGVFVLAVGSGTPTIGGARTSADGLLTLSGIENAMREISGYKPVVAESSIAAAPEVVITMMERNHGLDAKAMFSLPAFSGTPAAREKRLIPVPSHYLSFGPRTAHAARTLAAAVYPELTLPALPDRPWTAPSHAEGK